MDYRVQPQIFLSKLQLSKLAKTMINVLMALVLFIVLSSLVVYWIIEKKNKTINELYTDLKWSEERLSKLEEVCAKDFHKRQCEKYAIMRNYNDNCGFGFNSKFKAMTFKDLETSGSESD